MIIDKKLLFKLEKSTLLELLNVLYKIEDELNYDCKSISKTIDFLQDFIKE